MRVLLTGGAGYVGSACLRYLLAHGHEPYAFDNLSEGNAGAVPEGRLFTGDILNPGQLVEAMGQCRAEAVMHFAAVASVPDSIRDPDTYYRVNVVGTKNVLDAMRHHNIRGIIFSSTAATYGFQARMPLVEDAPQTPEVPYGNTKLAAEWLIRDYAKAYDIGYAFLRYFNASGADLDGRHGEARRHEAHLIPLILQAAMGQRPAVNIYGNDWPTRDGTCVRDYIHTADLAQAHQLCLEALTPAFRRAYNLGSGTGTTVLEVLQACAKAVGKPIPHAFAPARPGDPAVLVASPERIMKDLGWAPRHADINTIVTSAWRWHHAHPNGYAPGTPA